MCSGSYLKKIQTDFYQIRGTLCGPVFTNAVKTPVNQFMLVERRIHGLESSVLRLYVEILFI